MTSSGLLWRRAREESVTRAAAGQRGGRRRTLRPGRCFTWNEREQLSAGQVTRGGSARGERQDTMTRRVVAGE